MQEPRVRTGPEYASSRADEAIDLAALAGLYLDPWQQIGLEDMCGEQADGRWAAFEAAFLVARQNGKGGILEARELAGLFLWDERLIMHSAHEFKTAEEAFRRIKDLVDNTDVLRKRVKKITTAHGSEGIELLSGQRLRFVARSKGSGRGFTGDTLIFDEAQELPTLAVGALLPALSARPNAQVIYTGTVPSQENDCEHWTRTRDRGRRGDDTSLAWCEWSAGEEPVDEDPRILDREAAWLLANPSIGYRMTLETVQRERNTLDDGTFARERLSIWPSSTAKSVIEKRTWHAVGDPESKMTSPTMMLGLDVAPNSALASISVAGWRADGLAHIENIDRRQGSGWVVEGLVRLRELWDFSSVALDPMSPAGALIADIAAAGYTVHEMSTRQMVQASEALVNKVKNGELRHLGQKHLDLAATSATKRKVGQDGGWLFNRGTADITPVVSALIALYALQQQDVEKPPPTARVRVIGGPR